MDMLQQLQERYGRYIEEANAVTADAPAMAGLWGFGSDPRKNPCHMAFYKDVEQWVQEFRASGPDSRILFQAVRWILCAAAEHRNQPAYGYLYAAQGLCRELIGLLTKEQCGELLAFYDAHYPRQDRMPVQQEVCKLLQKGSGKKRKFGVF